VKRTAPAVIRHDAFIPDRQTIFGFLRHSQHAAAAPPAAWFIVDPSPIACCSSGSALRFQHSKSIGETVSGMGKSTPISAATPSMMQQAINRCRLGWTPASADAVRRLVEARLRIPQA
jgi:hypothetical protein